MYTCVYDIFVDLRNTAIFHRYFRLPEGTVALNRAYSVRWFHVARLCERCLFHGLCLLRGRVWMGVGQQGAIIQYPLVTKHGHGKTSVLYTEYNDNGMSCKSIGCFPVSIARSGFWSELVLPEEFRTTLLSCACRILELPRQRRADFLWSWAEPISAISAGWVSPASPSICSSPKFLISDEWFA